METLAFALKYIQQGYSVIALKAGSKIPFVNSWEAYQKTFASKGQLEDWFSNGHATNNIAIVKGRISRIIAYDIDGEEALARFNRAVESLDDEELKTALEDTMHIRTASGNTNIIVGVRIEEFTSAEDDKLLASPVLWTNGSKHSEIRAKGEGGYIVAPPSSLADGKRYELIDGKSAVSKLSKTQIYKLISAIRNQASSKNDWDSRTDSGNTDLKEEDVSNIVAILKPYYQHGNRNDFTMYLSGLMKKEGVSFQGALRVIESIAADDEEKSARIRTLEETYKKEDLDKVCGYSGLLSILVNQTQNREKAEQILDEVRSVFPKTSEVVKHTKQLTDTATKEEQKSPSQILIELAYENTSLFFKDQHGIALALVAPVEGRKELIPLESDKFKRYLAKLFYDNNDSSIANKESINNAIQILQANIEYHGQTIPLSLRITWKEDAICYDLTDVQWRYVEISKDGWQIKDDSSIMFVRHNQVAQVLPDRNYECDILDKFVGLTNVKDDKDKLLLKVYIISLFVPDIATMLMVHGEQGAAKSLLQRLIKQLVDPSRPVLLTLHASKDEFIQQLSHNYVAYYDNVRGTPKWLADEACKAVTGIGQTKRKLYTNDEDVVYEYKRCLGFSGINICMTEPDVLDRSILIELTRIPRDKRKLESQILSEFEQIKPKVLGYIFDVLVKALEIKPGLQLNDLPRMADFALWGEAISQAMGNRPLTFLNAYYDNIGRQNIEAIDSHPLAHVIAKYFEDENKGGVLKGSPLEILEVLKEFAQNHKVSTDSKLWPKSANSLSRRLNQIRSNLLEGLEIEVTISRTTTTKDKNKVNTSTIEIRKISPVSPISPVEQNHEGNCDKTTGDISGTGDNISPAGKIPPAENPQNQAQKPATGDTGGIGDIVSSSEWAAHTTAIREQKCHTFRFQCYYCNSFKTNSNDYYERHVIRKHGQGHPCYPSKADLEKLGLKPQAKSWEI
ncbi:MAG TPA: bifunctional DNA primase/polymerase [Nitrososphaeraceae archaeon]|nr:bifunctional DNA primase/polymerase [Nitrososphaeraceae archaeon]